MDNQKDKKDQQPEGAKEKAAKKKGNHDEGQYQEGEDKASMSPGSSEADVNPSATANKKNN